MRAFFFACLAPTFAAADADLSHRGQVQLSTRFAVGMRGIATYDETTFCGDTDSTTATGFAPVCTGRVPIAVDVELGYGITRAIDLLLELRIGIEQDFGARPGSDEGPRPLHVSPGARFFFSDAGTSKLFTTAQLVIDVAAYEDNAGKALGTDVGVRNMSGLWVDLDRAYGFYIYIAETATFTRWLRFELEAGIGLQGRYP
ncbi:MAG TPA: hypothetical protein VK427_00100 [Kofleriaceae bacterium]|nr:hypothetical protein [Kofleriaceae bacterium]